MDIILLHRPLNNGRAIARVRASDEEIAAAAATLARESVAFTFEPFPDGAYEISVKADQHRALSAAVGVR